MAVIKGKAYSLDRMSLRVYGIEITALKFYGRIAKIVLYAKASEGDRTSQV
jgi:hypothetical protein